MNVRSPAENTSVAVLISDMQPARRATPDSEAVGSSEDERPWPSSTSFGQRPMLQTSMSGLPGGIWSQGRGSFKMSEAAKRNALHDVRLNAGAAAQGSLRVGGTPSPAGDRTGNIPFNIPLQPVAKSGRSMSHSQGQREVLTPSSNLRTMQTNTQHSSNLPLGLLTEEADTDSEPELGSHLTQTTSHPPIGSLMRTTTLPTGFGAVTSPGNDQSYPESYSMHTGSNADRRLEASFADLSFADNQPRRSQWQSSLGWDDLRNVNESRRHSLADIPTRRGSLVGGDFGAVGSNTFHEVFEDDPDYAGLDADHAAASSGTHGLSHSGTFEIPHNYRAPQVDLNERERNELSVHRDAQLIAAMQPWTANSGARPRKQLYIVSFKCSRVDVFYLLEGTGLNVREGDLVIVEADRGQDLGTVQHANVTLEIAQALKKKYSEEQYKWLMMYSHNKEGANNPNADLQRDSNTNNDRPYYANDGSAGMQGNSAYSRGPTPGIKAKAIKRLAQAHEIKMLTEKEGQEAKAKRTCQQKVAHLRLQMEILDAEWQWDFQKLIFYYYADHYINFKDLITELYRIYKTRIWLSAINPASFSQHAMSQNPSSIGPGAVAPFNPYGLNNAYTMAYGEDRDPYGAQMPYRIGYDTYTPNYPSIPGVPNSFPSGAYPYGTGAQPGAQTSGASAPPTQHINENMTFSNGQNTLAQQPGYDLNSGQAHFTSPAQQGRGAQHMPSTMLSVDPSRSNYSFGPRAQAPSATRGGPSWDQSGRMNGASRGPAFPVPIGTRPAHSGEEHVGPTPFSPTSALNNGNNIHAGLHRYIGSLPTQPSGRVDSAQQNT